MTDLPDYAFGFIWDLADYKKIKALENHPDTMWQIRFGENGEFGAWEWTGDCRVRPMGGSVGAARNGEILCYPETDVVEAEI